MQGMIREKDDFYQKMFRLSIPIIIQGLLCYVPSILEEII